MFNIKSLLLVLSLTFFSSLAYASPEARWELSSSSITVDDTVTLKIIVEWPKIEGAYQIVKLTPNAIRLDLLRIGESQETQFRNGQEFTVKTLLYEFKPSGAGEGIIHAFEASFIAGSETLQQAPQVLSQIPSQKITIRPKSWLQSANPVMLVFHFLFWPSLGLGIAFFIHKQRLSKQNNPNPPLSVPERHLQEIENILKTQSSKERRDILYELGVEFRRFLADYYCLGSQYTESEILQLLSTREILREEMFQLKDIFRSLDTLRYAGKEVSVFDFDHIQKQIKRYMESKKAAGTF